MFGHDSGTRKISDATASDDVSPGLIIWISCGTADRAPAHVTQTTKAGKPRNRQKGSPTPTRDTGSPSPSAKNAVPREVVGLRANSPPSVSMLTTYARSVVANARAQQVGRHLKTPLLNFDGPRNLNRRAMVILNRAGISGDSFVGVTPLRCESHSADSTPARTRWAGRHRSARAVCDC
jgi:hypothetical protein